MVFGWFLQFIDRFLSILKTGIVPVFESSRPLHRLSDG
jgi:hypothetical protein